VYSEIPTILRSEEILDKALGRAAKIVKEDKEAMYRIRKTTSAQLESIRDVTMEALDRYVSTFPNLDKISTYERELLDIVVGVDPLKKALGRVKGAIDVLKAIMDDKIRYVNRTKDIQEMKKAKSSAIGRLSSIIKELDGSLRFMGRSRDIMRKIPDITPGDATIVVAGYPNVGKSSLLAKLSRARPDIAPYPFTTKSANIGHFVWPETGPEHRRTRYQVVDTPGLLEKPADKRNDIEQQAVLALQYLADVILFLLDPSEACGYDLPTQLKLLEHVRRDFPNVPMLVAENKVDLLRSKTKNVKISCETGEGIPELKKLVVQNVPVDKYQGFLDEGVESLRS
jgi:nucleolar GTP-binding protein